MALYDKMAKAMADKDIDAYTGLMSDDYQFVRHQSGETLNKSQMTDMVRAMMATGQWSVSDQRCLYENDDIVVAHSVMSFPDGSREAVMSVSTVRDGKVTKTETGATPLK